MKVLRISKCILLGSVGLFTLILAPLYIYQHSSPDAYPDIVAAMLAVWDRATTDI